MRNTAQKRNQKQVSMTLYINIHQQVQYIRLIAFGKILKEVSIPHYSRKKKCELILHVDIFIENNRNTEYYTSVYAGGK